MSRRGKHFHTTCLPGDDARGRHSTIIVAAHGKISMLTHRVTNTLTQHVIACTGINSGYRISRRVNFVGFNSHMSICLPIKARILIRVSRGIANGRAPVTHLKGWRGWVDVGGDVPGFIAYYDLVSNYVTYVVTLEKGLPVTAL